MRLTGALATHYHPDHVGGSMMGYTIAGVRELLALHPVPIHVQRDEAPWVLRVTECSESDLVQHDSGDTVMVGRDPDRADPHARPHARAASASSSTTGSCPATPSSSRAAGAPTSPAAIRPPSTSRSPQKLAKVPDHAVLFPGHLYSPEPSASMGDTRRSGTSCSGRRPAEQWMAMFGNR